MKFSLSSEQFGAYQKKKNRLGKITQWVFGKDREIQECLAWVFSLEEIVWENLNPVFVGKDREIQECLAWLSSLAEIVWD